MHSLYQFHFLTTVSEQLCLLLDQLKVTPLNDRAISDLIAFQVSEHAPQGVYLIYLDGNPFYLGKAGDVGQRLNEHLNKLEGRQKIDLTSAGYKALLLDKSMSTAANEDVLIAIFGKKHSGMWNNKGFGPKDPGQERDTTKPSAFDRGHPIRADYPVAKIHDRETVESLFTKLKDQLPYVFRYKLADEVESRTVDLTGVPRKADALLERAVNVLDPGWQGAILSYGMVVYKTDKTYKYATTVFKPAKVTKPTRR